MTRKCFFVESVGAGDGVVALSEQTAHHVDAVLRSRAGDRVELRDGLGNGWVGVIESTKAGRVTVRVTERQELQTESPLRITLALAMAKPDRMELIVRQATELGVYRLVAFRAQRSQYGLSGPQAGKRFERWERIAREAICQCGRARIPQIDILPDVSAFLDQLSGWEEDSSGSLRLLAFEDEDREDILSVWRSQPLSGHVVALVGPEGGWTTQEADLFIGAGFKSIRLGPRILRFETAAVAFLSTVQLLWGDLGNLDTKGKRL